VLSRFNLASRFAFTLTADDVVDGKPHPEIYLTAAKRFGIPPGEMLVLEDSENGCRAALDAGAVTVAVPGAHSERHNFAGVALIAQGLNDRRIYESLGLTTSGGTGILPVSSSEL
jgi:beta-phosphoglucomutase-like phosphatase (HAD superfamily)